uniref:Uncharacterized protein n=1 Tax=Schistocephalus solidus TaxID=70667 RepID=A0A0X3NW21_SCHSO
MRFQKTKEEFFLEYDVAEEQFPREKEKPNNIPATGDGEDGDTNMIYARMKNGGTVVRKVRKSSILKALSRNQRSGRTGVQTLVPSGPHQSANANPCKCNCVGLPPRRPIKQSDTVVWKSTTDKKLAVPVKVPHSIEAKVNYELMEGDQRKERPTDITDLDGEIELTKSVSLADFMRGDSSMATENFKLTELLPIQSMESSFSVSIHAPVNTKESTIAERILPKGEIKDAEASFYEELIGIEPECCPEEAGRLETVKPTTQDTCCELDLGRSVMFSPPQTNVSATERKELQPPDDSSVSTEVRKKGNAWRLCGGISFLLGMCTIRGRRKRWSKPQDECEISTQLQKPTCTTPSHRQEQPVADSEYSNPLLPSPIVIPASTEPSVKLTPEDADIKTITYSEHTSDGTISQVKLFESGAYVTTTKSAYNSTTRLPVGTTKSTQKKLTGEEPSSLNFEKSNFTGQPSVDIKLPLECDLMPDEEIKKMRRPKVLTSPYQQTDTFSFSEMGSGYGSPDFDQQAALPERLTTDDTRSYSLAVSNRLTEKQAEDVEDVSSTSSVTLEVFKAKQRSISEASVTSRWSILSEVTPCYAQMLFF